MRLANHLASASRTVRDRVALLQRGPYWPVAATLATLRASVRLRAPALSYRDADGDWIYREGPRQIASPTLYVSPAAVQDAEAHDIILYGAVVRRGATLIDVGAGVGEHLPALSRAVGPEGKVLAIEAHPGTFRCLQKTVNGSGLHNVLPIFGAASDSSGEVYISNNEVEGHLGNSVGTSGVPVPAFRLDDLLAKHNIDVVDLIKLNIEGAETAALRGLGARLPEIRRLVISCHDFVADQGGDASFRTSADVRALLEAAAFEIESRPGDPRAWVRDYLYATQDNARR
jgi:FkbM family methyltransferase